MAATWKQVCEMVQMLPGSQLYEDLWELDLAVGARESGRRQKILVVHEVIPPDLETIRVASPVTVVADTAADAAASEVAVTAETDLTRLLVDLGGLSVGGLNLISGDNGSAPVLCVGTVIPLELLDLGDFRYLMQYLSALSAEADRIEQELGARYGKRASKDYF